MCGAGAGRGQPTGRPRGQLTPARSAPATPGGDQADASTSLGPQRSPAQPQKEGRAWPDAPSQPRRNQPCRHRNLGAAASRSGKQEAAGLWRLVTRPQETHARPSCRWEDRGSPGLRWAGGWMTGESRCLKGTDAPRAEEELRPLITQPVTCQTEGGPSPSQRKRKILSGTGGKRGQAWLASSGSHPALEPRLPPPPGSPPGSFLLGPHFPPLQLLVVWVVFPLDQEPLQAALQSASPYISWPGHKGGWAACAVMGWAPRKASVGGAGPAIPALAHTLPSVGASEEVGNVLWGKPPLVSVPSGQSREPSGAERDGQEPQHAESRVGQA